MANAPEDSPSLSFHNEIKCMMYSLGDVRHPSHESAALVEEITKTQMENILLQAIKVIHMRGSHVINVEDILFLLRKDKCKLRRLLKHLHLREMLKNAASSKSTGTSENDQEMGEEEGFLPQPKKRKVSMSFLGPLDSGHSGLSESDKEEEDRLQKQDTLTNNMDSEEYVDYTECRRVSFYRKVSKFKEWLKIGSYNEVKPTQEVMEVLCYLAYDTVREIVEMSLLVKKDMENLYLDPSSTHNSHLSLPLSAADRLGRLSSIASGEATSNTTNSTCSPPSSLTPSSPKADTYSTTTTRSMQAGRRRNRNASTSQETSVAVTVNSSAPRSNTVDGSKSTRAIQPVHIREAMRRHSSLVGPLTPLATHFSKPTTNQRTLCL